ncbi:helix-turn-helix domain-containing protein [Marinobacterium sedimentorum]|uniref:helix-turn-helix domain-containing protein n=1 Tax=Marinobacterium sedimentorum TaxID=2927804 RepID=UPI002113A3FD|nr:helix-turn-helix domain-containing protein [Marinobacterium sedimentorum]
MHASGPALRGFQREPDSLLQLLDRPRHAIETAPRFRIALKARDSLGLIHRFLSVQQIAESLGFEDAAYFSRFYRKQTQLTPTEFRERVRSHQPLPTVGTSVDSH